MAEVQKHVTFADRLCEQVKIKNSILCAGFDPVVSDLPPHLGRRITDGNGKSLLAIEEAFLISGCAYVDAVAPFVPVFKINLGAFIGYAEWGMRAYRKIIAYARKRNLLVIADVKCADGGRMQESYARAHLGNVHFWDTEVRSPRNEIPSPIQADAVTIVYSTGSSGIAPFDAEARKHGRGVFLLAKTSFQPNSELDRLMIGTHGEPFWEWVGHQARKFGKGSEGYLGWRNIGVVAGATFPRESKRLREILPNSWQLKPGYQGQGATADNAIAGMNDEGLGCIVSTSSWLLNAWRKGKFKRPGEEFEEAIVCAAKAARDELNEARERELGRRRKG